MEFDFFPYHFVNDTHNLTLSIIIIIIFHYRFETDVLSQFQIRSGQETMVEVMDVNEAFLFQIEYVDEHLSISLLNLLVLLLHEEIEYVLACYLLFVYRVYYLIRKVRLKIWYIRQFQTEQFDFLLMFSNGKQQILQTQLTW